MIKNLLLTRSNIRKAKGQTLSIAVLVILAALLLNIWLVLVMNYSTNFDVRAESLNAEDAVFVYQRQESAETDRIQQIIAADPRASVVTSQDCLYFSASCRYNSGDINSNYILLPVEDALARTLGQFRFMERSVNKETESVYLPYLYHMGGGYEIGDSFTFRFSNATYAYPVGGFYENMNVGSFNSGICSILADRSVYEKIVAEQNVDFTVVSVKLKNRSDNRLFASEVGTKISRHQENIIYNVAYYDMTKQGRTLTTSICAAIISGIAFLIVLIALVVIAFSISNFIREEMKTLGTLKAMGYRSRQLITALLLQFLCIGIVSAFLGVGLSYAVLPLLDSLLVAQTGIPWEMTFLPLPLIISLGIIILTIAATVYLFSRKIKKIEPIVALKSGIMTHSFKHNPIPLDRTKAPLGLAMTMKTALTNLKQNIAVSVICVVLAFLVTFSMVMLQNFVIDPDPFLGLVAGEQADAAVYTQAESDEEIFTQLKNDSRVEKVYRYINQTVRCGDLSLTAYVTDNCKDLNNPGICYEGRLPKFANEVALGGKFAKEKGLKINDTVLLHTGGEEEEYLISGFIQCSNFLGQDCVLLTEGYRQIGNLSEVGYYINLKAGEDIKTFLDTVSAVNGAKISGTINIQQTTEGVLGVYTSLVAGIVAAIIVLSLVIVAFVLYLMVKALLAKKKQDFGVLKALGYTTRQLVLQTAGSFMPFAIGAVICGLVIGALTMNSFITLFFSGLGVMKCTFFIPPLLLTLSGVCLIVVAFIINCLVCLRIRRISPRALMAGE